MSIPQDYSQGIGLCFAALLGLAYSACSFRRLRRSSPTWRDGVALSQAAVLLGIATVSLALFAVRGGGLLTVVAYHREKPDIRAVFAGLHSEPTSKARAAALLKEVCGFGTVSRPTLAPAPPEVTEANQSGTSLDKALWLLARLDNSSARLVVGDDLAWVESADANRVEWIFDPAKREPVLKGFPSGNQYLARRVWSAADFAAAVRNPK